MLNMLQNTSFNQNISSWNIAAVSDMTNMLSNSAMSTRNYDSLLIAWSKQTSIARTLGAAGLKYSSGTAANARGTLTGTYGWSITDGGANANWPSSGAFAATSSITSSSFTLNWTAGSDAVTIPANLQYYVCSGTSANAIDTVDECLAATQEMNWTANTLSLNIGSKSASTAYYYNVVMRDENGDKVVYKGKAVTTAPVLTISTPLAASYINGSQAVSVTISGTCSENGRSVAITGSVTASTTCTSGNYTVAVNYSAISDGAISIIVNHDNAAGVFAAQQSRTLTKPLHHR